jgi:hypothetical protein
MSDFSEPERFFALIILVVVLSVLWVALLWR